MSNKLVIYHGNCADGFGAAWVVGTYFGFDNVDLYPGVYSETPPDVTGRDVIIVDFSYKKDVMTKMANDANSILVIDHHESAERELSDIPDVLTNLHYIDAMEEVGISVNQDAPVIAKYFDMSHSGAVLAWKFFFKDQGVPLLLQHIEDRDLWRFKLPKTRQIQAALFSFPYEMELWNDFITGGEEKVEELAKDGVAIERKHFKDINEFIDSTVFTQIIDGHEVPVINCPYFWSSDACNIMSEGKPFAAAFSIKKSEDGLIANYSLRSKEDGLNVAEIAEKFGGGGHKHASGFSIKADFIPNNIEEFKK